jgi:NDP-sugar pyrophosphorylase family protein
LSDYSHARIFDGINYPWQVLPFIAKYAQEFISTCAQEERQKGTVVGSVFIEDNVIIGEGTVIEHGAMIKGPTIIGKNC